MSALGHCHNSGRLTLTSGLPRTDIVGVRPHVSSEYGLAVTPSEQSLQVFRVQPLRLGAGYEVIYSYNGGLERRISDFGTEDEAQGWIVHNSTAWLKKLRGEK
jgi:hypothetical protein